MKDKINADSASPASGCSAARGEKIECAECGVLTTSDRADYAEGDGGMIPDRWFCHSCQESDRVPDYDEDDGEEICPSRHGGY